MFLEMWVIAVPTTVLGIVFIGFNIFLNVQYNHEWAGGNVFLMGNTVQGIVQFLSSLMLVYEH
jgi:hypothetical protein